MSGHSPRGRRTRHEEHEEHENHERWLVTYADMVTLLMVLFIVMFAMSQVDQKKFNELKEGLAAGFGASDSILEGNQSIQDEPGTQAVSQVAPDLSVSNMSADDQKLVSQAVDTAMQNASAQQQQRAYAEATAELRRLDEVRKQLLATLKKHHLQNDVQASYDDRGLVLSLVSRHVVFDADSAVLTARGQEVVDILAPVLKALPDPLEIDGHTNQEPVKPKYFASDWDLSGARAITVLRRLNEVYGIPADRLRSVAFGHTKPLVDPSKPGSQQINKRVDIVVLTQVDSSVAAQLPSAADELHLPTAGSLGESAASSTPTTAEGAH